MGAVPLSWPRPRQGHVEVEDRDSRPDGERGRLGPAEITVGVGDSLRLRLVSDDVLHGFGVGHTTFPPVDLKPGLPENVTLRFDRPGTYTFYCTRWCGVKHWRMRATIVVTGRTGEPAGEGEEPQHVALDLDLDAPDPAAAVPATAPDPARGRALLDRDGGARGTRRLHGSAYDAGGQGGAACGEDPAGRDGDRHA